MTLWYRFSEDKSLHSGKKMSTKVSNQRLPDELSMQFFIDLRYSLLQPEMKFKKNKKETSKTKVNFIFLSEYVLHYFSSN